MNVRDLRYLVALQEHKHFGRAAEACFVSQPALSMQIKKMEKFLGVQLLERSNKSVMLTPIGATLSDRAQTILHQVDEMKEIARLASDPFSGELKLGIFPTLAPYVLPHIAPRMAQSLPKLSLYLVEEQTGYLLDKLRQGEIDAAILALPVNEKGLQEMPLFDEEFLLAAPEGHALSKRGAVEQEELLGQPIMLLEDGHCMREQALSLCYRVKAKENQNFRATSLETLRHMVAAGLGITLIPKLACRKNDGIVYIPFKGVKPVRTLGLVVRNTSAKKVLLEKVAAEIQMEMLSILPKT